jgi:lysophospholipase L1-like esterase
MPKNASSLTPALRRLALVAGTVLACAGSAIPATPAGAATEGYRWVTGWQAAPADGSGMYMDAYPTSWTVSYPYGFNNQSLRIVASPHATGAYARVRLSNLFGTAPITVSSASVARRAARAALVAGTLTRLTFRGANSVVIPAGQEVFSDPVAISVAPFQDLAVSLAFSGPAPAPTSHGFGLQTSFVSPIGSGDQTMSVDGAAYTASTPMRFFVTSIEVLAASPAKTVVVAGDSISDGGPYAADTADTNARWPDDLQRRLLSAGSSLSVANAAIGGNQITRDAPPTSTVGGRSLENRFDRDVLSQPNLAGIILEEGGNDIGQQSVTADSLIAAYQRIAQRAHAAGVPIAITTITPTAGSVYDFPAFHATRAVVNDWIRSQHVFDAVIEFAHAVEDPAYPTRVLPAFDSGDHVHPNAAGLNALAQAIDLAELRRVFRDGQATATTSSASATSVATGAAPSVAARRVPLPRFSARRTGSCRNPGLSITVRAATGDRLTSFKVAIDGHRRYAHRMKGRTVRIRIGTVPAKAHRAAIRVTTTRTGTHDWSRRIAACR